MADIAKVRLLLKTIKGIAIHLNDEEISDIISVMQRAIDRMIKEQEGLK